MAKLQHAPVQHENRPSKTGFGVDEGLIILVFFMWILVLYHTYKVCPFHPLVKTSNLLQTFDGVLMFELDSIDEPVMKITSDEYLARF